MAKGRKERRRRRENRENPRLIGEIVSVSTKKSELAFTGEDDGESSGTAAAATLYIMDSSHLIGVDLNDLDEKMKLLAESAAEDPPYPLLTCDIDLEEDGYNSKSVLMKHGSKIFLVGGLADDDESRDVFVFDVFDAFDDKPIPSSKMNGHKYDPRVVTIEGSAYVFGIEYAELCPGQSYDDRDLDTPSFEVLPRGSNCWKALPDPPFYFKCDSKIEEELDSTFVIGSRIFVRTSIYPPFDREGFHVFNVESNEWDEKEVNLSWVKQSFESVGLKLPEYGRSVGGCDIGGEGNHVFLFSNYQYMEYEPCIWNFYAGIVTGTGILLWYQDITGVVLPSHTIPAGYDCHISHIQVLENLSACVTMYGWSESMDLKASVVCVSFFKFSLKQSHNQMSRTSSRTEFLSLLATKNYAFYVDRVATARSVLLSLGDMGGHSVWNKDTMAWPRDKETAFIGILYEKVKIGKLQCSTFTKDEWAKINEELRVATSWDYGIERLKGKWNRLRMAHRLFTSLIEHTGFTWDPNTNIVNAAEEVWNHFYTINKTEYKTFRKEGFRHYKVLGEIFHGTSATGGLHNASTEQPPTSDEERKMEDDFLNKGTYEHVETDDEGPITHRRENDTRRRRKEPKVNKSDQLSAAMTQWASSAAERSAESSLRQQYLQIKLTKLKQKENYNQDKENDPYSYDVCMEILNNMENVSDDAYTAGLKAFKDANFRKAFVKMPEIRRGPVLDRM